MSPRAWSNAFALAAVLVSRAARALAPAAKQAHPLFALSASQTPKSVNRVLSGDIERVDPKQLLHQLPLRPPDVKRASAALAADDSYLFDDAVISPEQARKLITYAKYRMPSAASGAAATEVDSVDGAPAYQADLPSSATGAAAALQELLGPDGYARLLAPAAALIGATPRSISGFIRKYSATTRPRLPFHCDGCDASISVNLSESDEYEGGDLIMLAGGAVRAAPRALGAAAAHSADVAHAVTDLKSGTRWSLVVFTHRHRNWRRSFRMTENGPRRQ
mmetsp:Transcript_34735/g.107463  ORF Transcript_34735/g.107463 Transcript_34735/m.107463 type:complete len:278 (+) Transcript_34735:1164-1997(+)